MEHLHEREARATGTAASNVRRLHHRHSARAHALHAPVVGELPAVGLQELREQHRVLVGARRKGAQQVVARAADEAPRASLARESSVLFAVRRGEDAPEVSQALYVLCATERFWGLPARFLKGAFTGSSVGFLSSL